MPMIVVLILLAIAMIIFITIWSVVIHEAEPPKTFKDWFFFPFFYVVYGMVLGAILVRISDLTYM